MVHGLWRTQYGVRWRLHAASIAVPPLPSPSTDDSRRCVVEAEILGSVQNKNKPSSYKHLGARSHFYYAYNWDILRLANTVNEEDPPVTLIGREMDLNAQLKAVEFKLAKDPSNQDLLSLKEDLIELISLSEETTESQDTNSSQCSSQHQQQGPKDSAKVGDIGAKDSKNVAVNSQQSNDSQMSEAERRKKEKKRKKRAKLLEKHKEQSEIAESGAQSWQSFASKKGLKGVTKQSIFASPCSIKGKVGVGTNGIADAPSATRK